LNGNGEKGKHRRRSLHTSNTSKTLTMSSTRLEQLSGEKESRKRGKGGTIEDREKFSCEGAMARGNVEPDLFHSKN